MIGLKFGKRKNMNDDEEKIIKLLDTLEAPNMELAKTIGDKGVIRNWTQQKILDNPKNILARLLLHLKGSVKIGGCFLNWLNENGYCTYLLGGEEFEYKKPPNNNYVYKIFNIDFVVIDGELYFVYLIHKNNKVMGFFELRTEYNSWIDHLNKAHNLNLSRDIHKDTINSFSFKHPKKGKTTNNSKIT